MTLNVNLFSGISLGAIIMINNIMSNIRMA